MTALPLNLGNCFFFIYWKMLTRFCLLCARQCQRLGIQRWIRHMLALKIFTAIGGETDTWTDAACSLCGLGKLFNLPNACFFSCKMGNSSYATTLSSRLNEVMDETCPSQCLAHSMHSINGSYSYYFSNTVIIISNFL